MKKILPLLLLICIVFIAAQKPPKKNDLGKFINKRYAPIADTLYADIYECTNMDYREFLFSLKKDGKTDIYNESVWDTLVWRVELSYGEPMMNYYHAHPAYDMYPALGVSYTGINHYCDWLAEQYHNKEDREYEKVKFRLPTEEEWLHAARGNRLNKPKYPWGGPYIQNKQGQYLARFDCTKSVDENPNVSQKKLDKYGCKTRCSTYMLANVQSYAPNNFGLFNIVGNVSEMLQEVGKTKGGNWKSSSRQLRIDANNRFKDEAERGTTVGFRVFMEVVEN